MDELDRRQEGSDCLAVTRLLNTASEMVKGLPERLMAAASSF